MPLWIARIPAHPRSPSRYPASRAWWWARLLSTPGPDLVVDGASVDSDKPDISTTFTLSATFRNQGADLAAATTLRYSTDRTISTSDTQVGTDPVGALAAGGDSDQSITLTAPPDGGTYYYGACVDTVTDESDATKQLLVVRISVRARPQQAGLGDGLDNCGQGCQCGYIVVRAECCRNSNQVRRATIAFRARSIGHTNLAMEVAMTRCPTRRARATTVPSDYERI